MPDTPHRSWVPAARERLAGARMALAERAKLVEALAAHDAYMLAGYSDPDDRALNPNAAENWRRTRAALALARGETNAV